MVTAIDKLLDTKDVDEDAVWAEVGSLMKEYKIRNRPYIAEIGKGNKEVLKERQEDRLRLTVTTAYFQ